MMAVTDYNTECGSLPLSFIQMLASCIVGYYDIAGVLHYRINGLEASDDCDETYGNPLDCDTSHVDPERQLVENVFATDECSILALKAFRNSSEPTDYGVCGEIPQSLLQMLARSIVTYNSHGRLNTFVATNHCDSLEDLVECPESLTDEVAERLLVENIFATDECDYLGVKLFSNVGGEQTGTAVDYVTPCVELPQSLLQLLARCIVLYNGTYYLNTIEVSGYCDDLEAFWTCANNHIDPERALAESIFVVDECGHLAVKWFDNQGESRQ
jgi:hypothetical protein